MIARFPKILLVLAALVAVNVASALLPLRLDLTADQRYTLTPGTRELLETLDDDVRVEVLLTGELPSGFRRLETAITETLDDFQTYANGRLTYRIADPDDEPTPDRKRRRYEQLEKAGLPPTNVVNSIAGRRTEKLVFPGVLIQYKGQQRAVLLLKGNKANSSEEQLNQSLEGVEFQLAQAIRQLTQPAEARPRVGLVAHTRVSPDRFSDLLATVQQDYNLFFVDLTKPGPLTGVDAVMVLKPDVPFTDTELFKLDQYVVNGGKALFFVDGARVDSVSVEGTFAQPLSVGLDDLFFRWGVRVNRNVVKDLNSAAIPLNVGNLGDKSNVQLLPWRFYPILNDFGPAQNAIVRNLDAIYARFASTLDTVRAPGILKTPLLRTSPYTQLRQAPVLIAYNEARQQPDPKEYNGGIRNVAFLLEGRFQSLYANRILPGDPRNAGFRPQGESARVIICADGDVVVNDVDYRRRVPLPLGYDRFTRNQFANKEFALNALDYVVNPNGLIAARNRRVTLRPLDKIKVAEGRVFWPALNVAGPVALVLVVGVIGQWWRRRKYGR